MARTDQPVALENQPVALETIAASADRSGALQCVTDEFGRAAQASAALLALGGWNGVPVGADWVYEASPGADNRPILDELVGQLRQAPGSQSEPVSDVIWRTEHRGNTDRDFIGVRVRAGGTPLAALCAALDRATVRPERLIELARNFAAMAGLCLIGGELGGRPHLGARNPFAISLDERGLRAAIAGEIARCGISGESLTLCHLGVPALAEFSGENGEQARLISVLGQIVAEAGQPYDFVGQVNSSELVVVIPGASHDDATATARHLMRITRLALRSMTEQHEVRTEYRLTEWDRGEDVEALLGRASNGAGGTDALYDRPS